MLALLTVALINVILMKIFTRSIVTSVNQPQDYTRTTTLKKLENAINQLLVALIQFQTQMVM